MKYLISEIATLLGIQEEKQQFEDKYISTILVDSRKLSNPSETVFFALETSKNDGHKYIPDLYKSGVKTFVISKVFPEWMELEDATFLLVENTLEALQKLAAHHRRKFNYPVIGITGSNGKTIVKEWLYQLLSEDYNIVRSPRSYNSQIGVPLSVWEMSKDNNLAIFEAGISQPEEMRQLEKIIQPTIGIFTELGEAHQENFTSLQQKCSEKLILFTGTDTFVYNKDSHVVNQSVEHQLLSQKSYPWSRKDFDAPLFIKEVEKNKNETVIKYSFLNFEHSTTVPFTDIASIDNAITCLAVMLYLKITPTVIQERMKKLEQVAMRLDVREGKNNCIIINDSYNSDVNSIKIALEFQKQRHTGNKLKKTLILSDILQTGILPKSLYKRVAQLIKENNVEKFVGIGPDIQSNHKLFTTKEKYFFKTTEEFIHSEIWKKFNNELILLKGARKFHFETINNLIEKRIHETQLEINLDAIVHNFNYYKSKLGPETKLITMVKADGYGSGASEIAKTLQYHHCEYFAVAIAEEGIKLRNQGITIPIIVLNPEVNSFEELYRANLEPEVYNFRILNAFIKEANRRGITNYPIHIKIDTGMHRLGFIPEDIPQLTKILKGQKALKVLSVFSHLAASESWTFDDFTNQQIYSLEQTHLQIQEQLGYEIWKHILNSAGIERFQNAQWDMVRLGIGLYGVSTSGTNGLQNVFTLKTTILQIKDILPNDTVGYGRKGIVTRPTRIATIRIGYADGLSRRFGKKEGKVLINNKLADILGSVCMDLTIIDVTDIDVKEGDQVIVFGKDLPIMELAQSINTIPYEILTSISSRVKRIYIKE